jgi:probable HAF family extracellular repeat protein
MQTRFVVATLSLGFALAACAQNPAPPTAQTSTSSSLKAQSLASQPIDLGTLGGANSVAYAINDNGAVVGSSLNAQGQTRAFLWTPQGGMTDLGTLGGNFAVARDINDKGHVVGYSQTSSNTVRAFLWTPQGGMRNLGSLGGDWSEATAIDEFDQVVGWSRTQPNGLRERGFFWYEPNGMRDLGILGNRTQFFDGSRANGLNELGFIVGTSSSPERDSQAAYWLTGTPDKVSLGQVSGGYYSEGRAINNRQQIVGFSMGSQFSGTRGFIWRPATGPVNLPEGFWQPRAISDDGVVVGSGTPYGAVYWSATTGLQALPTNNTFGNANDVNNKRQAVGSVVFPNSGTSGEGGQNQRAALWNLPAESFESLFDDNTRPANEAAQDPNAVELGVRFHAHTPGKVIGIRYYLGTQTGGRIETVNLWDDNGQLVASAKVDFQRAGEWQRVDFVTPVEIQPDRTYTASYHTLSGSYPYDNDYFDEPVTRGTLEAEPDAGVYRYGATSGFPTQTYRASNYWVDVVFKPN